MRPSIDLTDLIPTLEGKLRSYMNDYAFERATYGEIAMAAREGNNNPIGPRGLECEAIILPSYEKLIYPRQITKVLYRGKDLACFDGLITSPTGDTELLWITGSNITSGGKVYLVQTTYEAINEAIKYGLRGTLVYYMSDTAYEINIATLGDGVETNLSKHQREYGQISDYQVCKLDCQPDIDKICKKYYKAEFYYKKQLKATV
jgi:hypothetical protein